MLFRLRAVTWLAGVIILAESIGSFVAGAPYSPGPRPDGSLAAAPTNALIREVAPGVLEVGKVTIRTAARTAEFPGAVNMDRGPVEYLLVHEHGKIHESVFKTAASPFHLHLAALLLQPKKTNPPPREAAAGADPGGTPVRIEVHCRTNEVATVKSGEDFVFNRQTGAAMESGPWTYNGSRTVAGLLLAERDGSVAAVISDPDALLNGLRPGRDRDDIWLVNTNAVFPAGTPVTFVLHFPTNE